MSDRLPICPEQFGGGMQVERKLLVVTKRSLLIALAVMVLSTGLASASDWVQVKKRDGTVVDQAYCTTDVQRYANGGLRYCVLAAAKNTCPAGNTITYDEHGRFVSCTSPAPPTQGELRGQLDRTVGKVGDAFVLAVAGGIPAYQVTSTISTDMIQPIHPHVFAVFGTTTGHREIRVTDHRGTMIRFELNVSPPDFDYDGVARDFGPANPYGRPAAMALNSNGGRISGMLAVAGACQPASGVVTGSGVVFFEGTRNGAWEKWPTTIDGSWQGFDVDCNGKQTGNQGAIHMEIAQNGVMVRVTGTNKSLWYWFHPTNKVIP
jgi:hypothetical protein